MKKIFLAILMTLSLAAVNVQGSTKPNPFDRYNKKIASLEKQLEQAKENKKESIQKMLDKVKDMREKAVAKKLAPYEKKIEKMNKSLEKAKGKKKQAIQKKIDGYQAKINEIKEQADPEQKAEEKPAEK